MYSKSSDISVFVQDSRQARIVAHLLEVDSDNISSVKPDLYAGMNMNKIHQDLEQRVSQDAKDYDLSKEDIVESMHHYITSILPKEELSWIDKTNGRLCSFLNWVTTSYNVAESDLVPKEQLGERSLKGDRYDAVVFFCDRESLRYTAKKTLKDQQLEEIVSKLPNYEPDNPENSIRDSADNINSLLKDAWYEIEDLSSKYKSFLKKDEHFEIRQEWAWQYITSQGINASNIIKTDQDSYSDLVTLTFDALAFDCGRDYAELKLNKMRNAWYQKKSKMKEDTKPISFSLSPDSIKKLKELKTFHDKSNSALVAALIGSAHKKMLKQKLSLQDNLLDD